MIKNQCSICDRKDISLMYHHKNYIPEEVIVICKSCHTALVKAGKHKQRPKNFKSKIVEDNKKVIQIKDDTWYELTLLKIKNGGGSINDIITDLLKEVESK